MRHSIQHKQEEAEFILHSPLPSTLLLYYLESCQLLASLAQSNVYLSVAVLKKLTIKLYIGSLNLGSIWVTLKLATLNTEITIKHS